MQTVSALRGSCPPGQKAQGVEQRVRKSDKDLSCGAVLARAACEWPDSVALVYPRRGVSLTFAELDRLVTELARGFLEDGLEPGQRVALRGAGGPQWVAAQFAIARAGAVAVPLNPLLTAHEVGELLEHSEAAVLISAPGYREERYADLEGHSGVSVLLMDGERPNFTNLDEVALRGRSSELELPSVEPAQWALLMYTSGTTGRPKGVMLSHRNVVNNAHALMEGLAFGPQDRLCTQFPLFHCAGCVMSVLGAYSHGARLVPVEVFEPGLTLELVQDQRCTAIFGVPSMFMALFEEPGWEGFELSSLRTGTMGGSSCPDLLVRKIVRDLGVGQMTISYGLTETSPILTLSALNGGEEGLLGKVGHPIPETEIKVVSPQTGEQLPTGSEGEIVVRGPQLMMGYFRDQEGTEAVLDQEGWFRTGDLGRLNRDGSLSVLGRLKELIIRGGENISPVEVEDIIRQHPAVLDAAVYATPHTRLQETVGAAVRLEPGESLTLEQLRVFCGERLARFKLPEVLRVVEAFPTTASGKVQRFRLAEGVHHIDDR